MPWVRKSTDYALGGASFIVTGGFLLISDLLTWMSGGTSPTIFAAPAAGGVVLIGIGARWSRLALVFYRRERVESGLPPSLG